MMREFLEVYRQAINLDEKQYDCYLSKGVDRADFLLFDKQVICEVKEIQSIKIPSKVEKLSRKENLSEQNLKRDLYNSINNALSKANGQIEATKNVLNYLDALGLVILENSILKDLSVLSLIDAANRKMIGGLINVDCVLCLDFVNTFSDSESKPVTYAQVVARDTENARKLCDLLDRLIRDFCSQSDTPLLEGFHMEKGDQVWLTDKHGKYRTYEAQLDFKLPVSAVKANWRKRLAQLLDKWWWVIPIPAILYDWFIRLSMEANNSIRLQRAASQIL
jgi:hypothetical protein